MINNAFPLSSGLPERPSGETDGLRVLIIAENASARFGGEAILPLHYFRRLRQRGIEAWMIVHHRNRGELAGLIPEEIGRVYFVPDTWVHRCLVPLAPWVPPRIASFTIGQALHIYGQMYARRIARKLIDSHDIQVVHQPTPVSPKHASLLHSLGVPVVMGPMNGGMTPPPAFEHIESRTDRLFTRLGRACASVANRLIPGKLRADVLLVANKRTKRALPKGIQGRVELLTENGVDLRLWKRPNGGRAGRLNSGPVRFVNAGRLVGYKSVDLLLKATALARQSLDLRLEIIGDGECRAAWEAMAEELGLRGVVRFWGWLGQEQSAQVQSEAEVFVMPSLGDCGGAVVLEAMALGLPVIATNWGGPADYIDESCGILVEPNAPEEFVAGLAKAMLKLGQSPELRHQMGQAGYARVVREFDWERKIDRILDVYRNLVGGSAEALATRDRAGPLRPPGVRMGA